MPIIKYEDLSKSPLIRRSTYLDKKLSESVDEKIQKGEPIGFLPINYKETLSITGSKYVLIIFGILEDSRKAAITISNIPIILYVEKTERSMDILSSCDFSIEKEEMKKMSIYGYNVPHLNVFKLTFKNTFERNILLKQFDNNGVATYMNDRNYVDLIPVISESTKSLAQWSIISNYKDKPRVEKLIKSLIPIFNVTYDNYQVITDISSECIKYKELVEVWDTEVYATGQFPVPTEEKDIMFCVDLSYGWRKSPNVLVSFTLTLFECNDLPHTNIVLCRTEADLLSAILLIRFGMMPDYIMGYNDQSFDWKELIARLRLHSLLLDYINHTSLIEIVVPNSLEKTNKNIEYILKDFKIKLDADSYIKCEAIRLPNYIACDIFHCLKRENKSMASYKLGAFLEKYELPNKEDMKISRMNSIVKDLLRDCKLRDEMTEIASYCNTDSVSVFRLDNKVNYIGDGRAIADLSRTTIYGSFYKAGAYRVGNMIGHRYYHNNYIYSTIVTNNSTSFRGAFVVQPPRGFITSKQSLKELGLDNKELHEQIFKTAAVADKIIKSTQDYVEFIADEKEYKIIRPTELRSSEWDIFIKFLSTTTYYPDGDIDYVSLYPSIVITYNISPEKQLVKESKLNGTETIIKQDVVFSDTDSRTVELIRHDSDPEKFGIIPSMLRDIFLGRIKIKNIIKALKIKNPKDPMIEYWDMVQKAKKLMMNTTYGVMGSGFSFIAVKELAAMVTTMGRILLDQISKFALENGVIRRYGDTDSGYFYLLKKWFAEVDRLYYSNQMTKEAYYKELHAITKREITAFEHKCNKMLEVFSGFNQLQTEFGHSHFPILYANKKQYASCVDGNLIVDPHKLETYEDIQTYVKLCMDKDKGLFIKGLSLKKRNASGFLKETMCIILVKLLAVNNSHSSTLDFTKRFITENLLAPSGDTDELNTKIPFKKSDFIRNIQFKGASDGKQGNITLLEFAERMKKNGGKVPERNDIIEYVYVDRKDTYYSDSGAVMHPKTSEYMEWYVDAERYNYKISIKQYIKSELSGSLASIIAFHPNFNEFSIDDDEDSKIKKSIIKAKRFIESKCIPQTKSVSKTRIYSKVDSMLRGYGSLIFKDKIREIEMKGVKDGEQLAIKMNIDDPLQRKYILEKYSSLLASFDEKISGINLNIKAEEKRVGEYINKELIIEIRDELGIQSLIPKKSTDVKKTDVQIHDACSKIINKHKAKIFDPFENMFKELYEVICMREAMSVCYKKITDNLHISKKDIDSIFESQSVMDAISSIKD